MDEEGSEKSIASASFDFVGTPVAVTVEANEFLRQEDEEETAAGTAIAEGACATCGRVPRGEGLDRLLHCSVCNTDTCHPCVTKAICRQIALGRAPEALRCDGCENTVPIQEALHLSPKRCFPHLWKTRRCPLCNNRSTKHQCEDQVLCRACKFLFCAWCKKVFPSMWVGRAHLTDGRHRCACSKFRAGAKNIVKFGAYSIIIPLAAVGVALGAPIILALYALGHSEERDRIIEQIERTLGAFYSDTDDSTVPEN